MAQDSMWDVLDDFEKKESSGGGLTGLVEVSLGYKTFISGLTQEETFFPFAPGDEAAEEKAKKAAKSLLEKNGVASRPQVSVQFRVFRDKVIGREVTWQGDRFFAHPVWTDAYKKVVKPAMKEAGITSMGQYWATIGFADDPGGRQEVKANGELGPAQVEHIVKVYKNRAAAEAALGAQDGAAPSKNAPSDNVPDGWDSDSWDAIKDEIISALGDKPAPSEVAKIAKEYGITVKDIRALLG